MLLIEIDMRKPFIAVTPSTDTPGRYHVSAPYFESLERAGAIPVLLPMHPGDDGIKEIANSFDGFLFAGGCDAAPYLYGEETLLCCGEIQPERDRLEIALYHEIKKLNKPCLAICRGIQIINVAEGGSLYQDIPTQFKPENGSGMLQHRQVFAANIPSQHVKLEEGSMVRQIMGTDVILVNSHHHQAVKKLGGGFEVTARSLDGIIEAIERKDMSFCIGVQWHPEQLSSQMKEEAALFDAFVKACGK